LKEQLKNGALNVADGSNISSLSDGNQGALLDSNRNDDQYYLCI
jgi:hypothetical protein